MTITTYGRRQVLLMTIIAALLAILLWRFCPASRPWAQILLAVIALLLAAFFRDPHRTIPNDKNILLAPADGKVTDIVELEETTFFNQPVRRIGIFLSVMDVHINRAPCPGKVIYKQYRPGKCLNALRHEDASAQNQACSLGLTCPDHPASQVMIRQITGAIARRIVCAVDIDDTLESGQQYGMIKFGSRTELFWPADRPCDIAVKIGDTVRAGQTIMVRFNQAPA